MKISGWEDRDDPIANGALDDLDWTKHKVVVAVGCSIVSAEDKDGTLSVELKSATSGRDRQYEALVVATEASESASIAPWAAAADAAADASSAVADGGDGGVDREEGDSEKEQEEDDDDDSNNDGEEQGEEEEGDDSCGLQPPSEEANKAMQALVQRMSKRRTLK